MHIEFEYPAMSIRSVTHSAQCINVYRIERLYGQGFQGVRRCPSSFQPGAVLIRKQ